MNMFHYIRGRIRVYFTISLRQERPRERANFTHPHFSRRPTFWLDDRWVKATPAFDLTLCQRHDVLPLEFDGREDSIFHPHDGRGRKHMEYARFIGEFDDLPFEDFAQEMRKADPRMLPAFAAQREQTKPQPA